MRIPEEPLWLGLPQGLGGRPGQTPQGSSWALRAGEDSAEALLGMGVARVAQLSQCVRACGTRA